MGLLDIFKKKKEVKKEVKAPAKKDEKKVKKPVKKVEKKPVAKKEPVKRIEKLGMNLENYGKWHVDHIIPVSFFKFKNTDDVEFKMCWRLENLQPLWEKDNLEKIDKMILWRKKINARQIGD